MAVSGVRVPDARSTTSLRVTLASRKAVRPTFQSGPGRSSWPRSSHSKPREPERSSVPAARESVDPDGYRAARRARPYGGRESQALRRCREVSRGTNGHRLARSHGGKASLAAFVAGDM